MINLTEEQLNYIVETVVEPLEKRGAEVYCFGSRARGEGQAFSDLDLMVVSEHPLDSEISEIRQVLEDSNFPFVVDIVEERNFADSYRANYLAERVLIRSAVA
ncbi:MAG: nucleotidyltransferase domain-containing protein [Pseudomonadales bacterium]|nr:nucleotidyltransferase domain-containing protein [Pseudomonadales bacterium]